MASLAEDLEHAAKYLDDASVMARNAAVLLERVSPQLAEETLIAVTVQEESRERVRSLLRTLESV